VVIGLELDDHAADTVDQQSCADQFRRDIKDRAIEKRTAKARGRHRRKLHIPLRLSFRVGASAAREPGIQKHASVRSARGRSHEASCGSGRGRFSRTRAAPGGPPGGHCAGSRFAETVRFLGEAHDARVSREGARHDLARHLPLRECGKRRQAYPRPRQTASTITLVLQRHRKCCRLPTPVSTLQQF